MPRKTVFCDVPFTQMQINPKGEIYLCCPAWTTFGPVGKLTQDNTLEQIWNNQKSQEVRRHILRGETHAVCNLKYCPMAMTGKPVPLSVKDPAFKRAYREIQQEHVVMNTFPRRLIVAHSGRCNLRCVMCVSHEGYVPDNPKLNKLVFVRELPRMLFGLSEIVMCGNGDPFFMKDAREFLQRFDAGRYPNVRFDLITNAIMFTEQMWNTVKHNHYNWINVSVDAATKETYEKIRKGGLWRILQENLKLISRLRRDKVFSQFIMSFVVMKSNYREMKAFVELANKLGCDNIKLQKIFGWSAPEENINLTRNYRAMKEIGQILKDPVFSASNVDTTLVDPYRQYVGKTVSALGDTHTFLAEKIFSRLLGIRKLKLKIQNQFG